MDAAERGDALSGEKRLDVADRGLEFLMNALRLPAGVAASLFTERTGLPLSALEPGLQQARARGWLSADTERLQATDEGLRWLDELLEGFVPD